MKVKVGERYRAPSDCMCECGKRDCVINNILADGFVEIKCCGCGLLVNLHIKEEMFGKFEDPYIFISKKKLLKERMKAPFESK